MRLLCFSRDALAAAVIPAMIYNAQQQGSCFALNPVICMVTSLKWF